MPPKNNVLVIGGAGYIGSHTTPALNEADYTTAVYDNFSACHRDACCGAHLVEGARGLRPDIKTYGTDYDTPDGTCISNYIHETDRRPGDPARLVANPQVARTMLSWTAPSNRLYKTHGTMPKPTSRDHIHKWPDCRRATLHHPKSTRPTGA